MSDYLTILPLSDVKAFLNIDDTTADSWLEREIASQLQAIEEYLERPVTPQRFREDLDGTGYRTLDFDHTPVQSVLSVNVDPYRKFSGSTNQTETDYAIDAEGIELRYSYFPCGRRNVRVEYIAGFADITIPFGQRRFDFREMDSGDLLTAYLPTGVFTPTDLAEHLQTALNDGGDAEKSVAFDWTHRRFELSTDSDYLQVVTSLTNTFTASESATGLLGFSADAVLTDDVILGDTVTLSMPDAIKGVALEMIAMQYVKSAVNTNNGNRYGVQTYRLDDFQITYDTRNETAVNQTTGMTPKLENALKPWKRWRLF